MFGISIHAPSRERLCSGVGISTPSIFQSTLPYGSDLLYCLCDATNHISIHAPLRERQNLPGYCTLPGKNFNPRSLTEATARVSGFLRGGMHISIHAPSRERPEASEPLPFYRLFQSTLPHGSDDKANDWAIRCVHISIHAPSRERPGYNLFRSPTLISIHAPSRERPHAGKQIPPQHCDFNPRSLTGATGRNGKHHMARVYFNPRSLTGATLVLMNDFKAIQNFNPRSLTGATCCLCIRKLHYPYFNPRSLTGATSFMHTTHSPLTDFNPRSLTGATGWAVIKPSCTRFQSTLPHGSDMRSEYKC